jgi:hypothetical protein
LEGLQAKIEAVFDEPVLRLQVLGGEEGTFCPQNWLQLLHSVPTGANNNKYFPKNQIAVPNAEARGP